MPVIYVIESDLTNNKYVGQTVGTIQKRWNEHKHASKKYDYPLYKAFDKYGVNNFSIRILEECPIELLNEREKYWISYFDSKNNGYNSTIGGDGNQKYSTSDMENIIDLYLKLGSSRAVGRKLNIDHETVMGIVDGYGVERISKQVTATPIKIVELDMTFESQRDCARWLIDTGKTKQTKINKVAECVNRVLRDERKTFLKYTYVKLEEV